MARNPCLFFIHPRPDSRPGRQEIASPRHQRETYRKELMVMAPTLQLMFRKAITQPV